MLCGIKTIYGIYEMFCEILEKLEAVDGIQSFMTLNYLGNGKDYFY